MVYQDKNVKKKTCSTKRGETNKQKELATQYTKVRKQQEAMQRKKSVYEIRTVKPHELKINRTDYQDQTKISKK